MFKILTKTTEAWEKNTSNSADVKAVIADTLKSADLTKTNMILITPLKDRKPREKKENVEKAAKTKK